MIKNILYYQTHNCLFCDIIFRLLESLTTPFWWVIVGADLVWYRFFLNCPLQQKTLFSLDIIRLPTKKKNRNNYFDTSKTWNSIQLKENKKNRSHISSIDSHNSKSNDGLVTSTWPPYISSTTTTKRNWNGVVLSQSICPKVKKQPWNIHKT